MIEPVTAITTEEKQRALKEALGSQTFARSDQLRGFLKYVCEMEIAGRGGEINEYSIGTEVLGRPSDFSPGENATVRNRTYALRNKLQEFYTREKPDAALRIELPKGSYCPQFIVSDPPAEVVPAISAQSDIIPPALAITPPAGYTRWNGRRLIWISAVVLIAACTIWLLTNRRAGQSKTDAVVNEFWAPVLESAPPVLVYLGQSATYHLSRRLHDEYLRQNPDKLNLKPYVLPLAPGTKILPEDIIPVPNIYIGAGDAFAAVQFTSFLNQHSKATRLRIGNDTSFSDLRDSPSVLVGAFSNAWTIQMTRQFRFVFEKELVANGAIWRVKDQQAPEQREWSLKNVYPAVQTDTDYAIVTRVLNSPSGKALLSAAGITTFGTQAAAEFLTTPDYLNKFADSAPAGWKHQNVQVVLAVKIIENTPGPPMVIATHVW